MPQPLSCVILDFETNGAKLPNGQLDVPNQLPTEVVCIRVVEDEVTGIFNTLVEYDHTVHGWTEYLASPANYHTQDELRKGMPEAMLAEILWQFLAGGEIVVAYNALFDLQVALEIFRRHFKGDASHFEDNVQFIDPLTVARDRKPYPHKLGDMCRAYNIPLEDAHLAMDDGMALVELVKAMHREADITPYINVAGYKRQYGEPLWVPKHATLKPQGNETIWHNKDGSTEHRQGVKRNIVPTKKVVPQKRVPGIVPKPINNPDFEKVTQEDVNIMLRGGDYVENLPKYNGFEEGQLYHHQELGVTFTIRYVFVHHESECAWLILEYNGELYAHNIPY